MCVALTLQDLIIFPDDAVFRKVKEANARVYVLEFKNDDKKLFFWMQEPKTDKDEQYCTDLNKFMNNPPQPGAGGLEGLGNMDQQQLLQMLAGSQGGGLGNLLRGLRRPQAQQSRANEPPATPATPTTTPTSSGTPTARPTNTGISLSFLQNALANATQRSTVG